MNTTPKNPITDRPIQAEETLVGTFIVLAPDPVNTACNFVLTMALQAALIRGGITGFIHDSIFGPFASFHIFTVPKPRSGPAVEILKAELDAFRLGPRYTIARLTDDAAWFTVYGTGKGGISFEKFFGAMHTIEECNAWMKKCELEREGTLREIEGIISYWKKAIGGEAEEHSPEV